MSCSPLASFGNQRACCSGVPASVIGSEPSSWTARISPVVAQARLSCSTARQTLSSSPPRPPYSSGNGRARMSWSARRRRRSSGNSAVRSISAARGATRSSASTRTASRSISCSSVRRNGPGARFAVVTGGIVPRAGPALAVSGGRRLGGVGESGTGARLQSAGDDRGPDHPDPGPCPHRRPGIVAVITILRRDRVAPEEPPAESPFAVATEGMKRCPSCGMGNLVTDDNCSNCGTRLVG